MIIFSAIPGAACEVSTGSFSFFVFPDKIMKDEWCLLSHPEEELQKKVVSWPGEYDFGGIIMRGVGQEQGRQVSYTCETDGVRFAFIDSPLLEWSDSEIEGLGGIDVLVIAADDAKKATKIIEDVDPRVVLLIPTKDGDLAAVSKAVGAKPESVTEYKVKPGSMPSEAREVVVLGK